MNPSGATTPGTIITVAAPGSGEFSTMTAASDINNTAATTSSVTSASSVAAGSEGSLAGQLRPWEVALMESASVALATVIAAGLTASLVSTDQVGTLFLSRSAGKRVDSRAS